MNCNTFPWPPDTFETQTQINRLRDGFLATATSNQTGHQALLDAG